MRSALPIVVLAAALATAAPRANAQAPADSIGPRAGSWGGEATYGGVPGATLLYFSSPSAAWLAGVAFSATSQTGDAVTFQGGTTEESFFAGIVDARVGRRWWRGEATARLRPLIGIGVTGSLTNFTSTRAWNAGGYGELGATYFFSPHVSLGASGELALGYGEERRSSGSATISDLVTRRWFVRGNLVRISAGVYF